MQTLLRLVKSFSIRPPTTPDPCDRLFLQFDLLDDCFYLQLTNQILLNPEKYKSVFESKAKYPLPRVVILRVLIVWHRIIQEAPDTVSFLRELELNAVNNRKQNKQVTMDLLIENYKEYLQRRAVLSLEELEEWTLKRWVAVSYQLIRLLKCMFKIEILLENQWNKLKNQPVFSLISQSFIRDSHTFLSILFQFITLHSKLILEDHPQTDTINNLYEQILFLSREAEKRLARISKEEIPKYVVDREMNKSIEFHMRKRKEQRRKTASERSIGVGVEQTDDELQGEWMKPVRQPYTNEI